MRNLHLAIALVCFVFAGAATAYQIEPENCYFIDGPANVRDKPDGHVIASLENGSPVRVIDSYRDAWYLVEYAFRTAGADCRFDASERGWTYFSNLLPEGKPLGDLAREGKLMYAVSETGVSGSDSIVFLGEHYRIDCEDELGPCRLIVPQPYEITVYCLDGHTRRARISGIELDWGGDQDAWFADVSFRGDIPAEGCIVVDGAIASGGAAVSGESENVCRECEKGIVMGTTEMACSYRVGDFENDGIKEAIVHTTTVAGAPSYEAYDLFRLENSCEGVRLGNLFHLSIP